MDSIDFIFRWNPCLFYPLAALADNIADSNTPLLIRTPLPIWRRASPFSLFSRQIPVKAAILPQRRKVRCDSAMMYSKHSDMILLLFLFCVDDSQGQLF